MKCGDLVRIPKARIGVPANSLGLIVGANRSDPRHWYIYEVQLVHDGNRVVRRLARDLEVTTWIEKCK